jgi:hypothetical protein
LGEGGQTFRKYDILATKLFGNFQITVGEARNIFV